MALLREGQEIRDTYEVERFLGEGAFAEVYRVKHRFMGRQAMKVFKATGFTISETEKMLEEALLLSRIGHPHIIRVFDANVTQTSEGWRGFFTMEYVAGGTLEKFWQSFGSRLVPVEISVEIIKQVCRGLVCAHSDTPPIIHRDIKPQNILIGYDATGIRARLCDFGLAKKSSLLTGFVSARGTPAFKAPEVIRGGKEDSRASDVWALGATLYLQLTDRLPYSQLDGSDHTHFDRPLHLPSQINLQVDSVLDQIVSHALAPKPEDRCQDAQEFLDDLLKWSPNQQVVKAASKLTTKTVLGVHTPHNKAEAQRMARKALALSKGANKLGVAADLMEEAFNRWPGLRERHEYRVKLWRCGISQ